MTENTFREELERLLPAPRARWAWLVLGGVFVWFYWPCLRYLLRTWQTQEDYHFCFLVPFFALFLLWLRRDMIPQGAGRGHFWGLPLFALWAAMQWAAVYLHSYDNTVPGLLMLPFLAGVALFVGGWQGLRWAWPAILFLVFMQILPRVVQDFSRERLQVTATRISVYAIQTLGIPAIAEGNVIQLTDRSLSVAEACSGLRMMMLFFAICVGAAFVVQRTWWEKLIMVASAAPIAVLANASRIVVTAILLEIAGWWPSVVDIELAEEVIHGGAGYLMMPVGLLLLLTEMWLLSSLWPAPATTQLPVTGPVFGAGGGIAATAMQRIRRREKGR